MFQQQKIQTFSFSCFIIWSHLEPNFGVVQVCVPPKQPICSLKTFQIIWFLWNAVRNILVYKNIDFFIYNILKFPLWKLFKSNSWKSATCEYSKHGFYFSILKKVIYFKLQKVLLTKFGVWFFTAGSNTAASSLVFSQSLCGSLPCTPSSEIIKEQCLWIPALARTKQER